MFLQPEIQDDFEVNSEVHAVVLEKLAQLVDVRLDGALRDADFTADVFVAEAADQALRDLFLARVQLDCVDRRQQPLIENGKLRLTAGGYVRIVLAVSDAPDGLDQLTGATFHHVTVRASVDHGLVDVFPVGVDGVDEDFRSTECRLVADVAEDRKTVFDRHGDVEDDDVRRGRHETFQRVDRAALGAHDAELGDDSEDVADVRDVARIVVDDRDVRFVFRGAFQDGGGYGGAGLSFRSTDIIKI